MTTAEHYRPPGWFTRNVFNRTVARLTRMGISVLGSRVLETRGRQSGQPRRTPVNLLAIDGHEYLVSPRGNGQWVRNVRADNGRLTIRFVVACDFDAERAAIREAIRRAAGEADSARNMQTRFEDDEITAMGSQTQPAGSWVGKVAMSTLDPGSTLFVTASLENRTSISYAASIKAHAAGMEL